MTRTLALVFLAAAACSGSGSSAPEVYGAATIGPEGGDLVITSGPQAGLQLMVPPGALAAPTELRVVATVLRPMDVGTVILGPEPGEAFELQPVGLVFELLAVLRAPYDADTRSPAPWNVRVRRLLGSNSYDIEPVGNDPVTKRVDAPVRTLGRYQVVRGPSASTIGDYRQPVGTSVSLTDGYTLAVEEVPAGSPFAGPNTQCWRITGPSVEDLLYFAGDRLRGRESPVGNWREVWSEPYDCWQFGGGAALPPPALTTTIGFSTPMGYPPLGGSLQVWGFTTAASPRIVAERLFCDVTQLNLSLAWARPDGVGQRQYAFHFAPGVGLLGFSQDGVQYERTGF